jgi:Flp pilus assembly protein TadG
MITVARLVRKLTRDCRGSVIVEFAIIAPVLLTLLMGVMTMGLHMFSANALQSAGSDTARWAVVEYQKGNRVSAEQISDKLTAVAITPPYSLDINRLDVTAQPVTTDITGTIKFEVTLAYTPYNPLEFAGIGSPRIGSTRVFYVAST